MDDFMADNTLNCYPSTNSSCFRPTDGFGGSLYSVQFNLPSYDPSYPNPTISLQDIDLYYQYGAQLVFVEAIGLGLCALTITNILVLTPPHKRRFLHHVLLIGNVAQVIRCSTYASLIMNGYLSSAYLALVDDWSSSNWSPRFRILVLVANISICVSFACVEIAFYTLSHGVLAWLRLKCPVYVYHVLMATMVFISLFAYLWRVVFAIDEIRFVAFQPNGASIPELLMRPWYVTLEVGRKVTLGVSLGLWSAIFAISATIIIWERRKCLSWSEDRGLGDRVTMSGKRKKVQSGYEKALQIIGLLAVESFVIPLAFCVLDLATEDIDINMVSIDNLIIPTILALLPVLSLFNGGNLRADTEHSDASRPTQGRISRTPFQMEG